MLVVWNDKLMRWEPAHWSASHLEGKVVTLKAIASIRSKFVRWEGDENSTSEIIKIKMNSKKEVIAIFTEIETFPLQVDAIGMGMGTITRTPEAYAGRHPKDTVVTLTAKASENSKFLRWDGDATGTSDTCTITMDKAKEVCAVFAQMFPLKVNLHGGGKGSITRTPEADTYLDGTVVTLTANASKGSKFKSWWAASPLKTVSGQTCTVTMNSEKRVSAWFEPLDYFPLAISKIGTGGGEVTSTPEADTHRENTVVTLTAKAFENSKFVRWEGDASGSSETCTVTMDRAKKVSAVFANIEMFGLQVDVIGTGKGSITQTPEADTYEEGAVVTLIAKASENSRFVRWEGDANGLGEICTITIDSSKSVSAVFAKIETFTLQVDAIGTGQGSITQTPQADAYVEGTVVTLTAKAAENSRFVRWEGGANGLGEICTITIDSSKSVSAVFAKLFPLEVNVVGSGSGTVRLTPLADQLWLLKRDVTSEKITRVPETHAYFIGSVVTLTANPSTNSKFVCWEGDADGSSETCTLTMDRAKRVSAVFANIEMFGLQVDAIGTGKGTITQTPKADIYEEDTVVTLTARASKNSKFVRWEGDASGSSETCTVTMDEAKEVRAVFAQMFSLKISVTGAGKGSVTRTPEADSYLDGTVVTLTAHSSEGSKFNWWRWIERDKDNSIHRKSSYRDYAGQTCTVTMVSDRTIYAHFEPLDYFPMTLSKIGTGKGSITQTPKADSYPEGAIVTLTAKASENSKFVRWEGDASGSSETCTVTMNDAKNVSALFVKSIEAEFESVETAPSQRIETLEHNLMLALKQIEQLQKQLSQAAAPNLPTPSREVPLIPERNDQVSSSVGDPLLETLKWLATQERVALSEFRRRLLPLDLLTGPVIEDVNERALDVRGEIALEEDGDDIVVMQDVLAAVLVAWTPRQH